MPNTLTNVKDIKVAQRALMPFMSNLLPVTAFSTDFSPLPAEKQPPFPRPPVRPNACFTSLPQKANS